MNSPSAANTSAPIQTQAAATNHRYVNPGSMYGTPVSLPTMKTASTEQRPRTIATIVLMIMYEVGDSGVIRSWRLQPWARSIDTIAPPAVVASAAPYRAMLTSRYADT